LSEFFEDEAYEAGLQEVGSALLGDTINTLTPHDPICLSESMTVHDAVVRMLSGKQAAVLIVDGEGRLSGIFTERDVLTRVVGRGLDSRTVLLGQVMTAQPEALSPRDRICYAVHQMSVAGYRTIPLVDEERKPIGVVTVSHVIKWLADLFPEAVLNLRPGDTIKQPGTLDAG